MHDVVNISAAAVCVPHEQFKTMDLLCHVEKEPLVNNPIFFEVQPCLNKEYVERHGFILLRL